jgi:hypothetical protein
MSPAVYLSLPQLAAYASLSVRTLRSYLAHPQHPLPHYKLPGKILVRRDEFDAWIARYRVAASTLPDLDRLVNEIIADL